MLPLVSCSLTAPRLHAHHARLQHCGQWAQDQQLGPNGEFNDFNVTILTGSGSGSGSITAVPAVSQWYASVMSGSVPADPDAFVWLQQATYPCNNCCQGGQS